MASSLHPDYRDAFLAISFAFFLHYDYSFVVIPLQESLGGHLLWSHGNLGGIILDPQLGQKCAYLNSHVV